MLYDAINAWKKLLSIYSKGAEKNWYSIVGDLNENIKLAMSLDETYVTAIMILRNSLASYIEDLSVPFSQLLSNRKSLFEFIEKFDDLNKMLYTPDVEKTINDFRNSIIAVLDKNGFKMDDKEFVEMINDDYSLAELRLSALHSVQTLNVAQFSRGDDGFDEMYSTKSITQFDDINTLLLYLRSDMAKDGVFLNLIGDPDDFRFSYFAFVVKRGDNVFLISDKEKLPSVNYRQTGRGRGKDRDFAERVAAHWFPYEVIVEVDEENARWVRTSNQYAKDIVLREGMWSIVADVDDILPQERIWYAIVLSLLQQKYFGNTVTHESELSYTNIMAESGEETNETALAITTKFSETELSKVYNTVDIGDLNTHSPIEEYGDIWDSPPQGIFQWMEDRYKPNIQKYTAKSLLRAPGETRVLYIDSGDIATNPVEDKWAFANGDKYYRLADVRLSDWGTKDEVKKSVAFAARHAAARMVYSLAYEEYENRKTELKNWYRDALEDNMESIKRAIAKGELIATVTTHYTDFVKGQSGNVRRENILSFHDRNNANGRFWSVGGYYRTCFYRGRMFLQKELKCYFTGKHPSIAASFDVNNYNAICDVTGLKRNELPDVLQNYNKHHPYTGNNILSTLDPMDNIKDPFSENFNLNFVVYLSKSHLNKLRKTYGS